MGNPNRRRILEKEKFYEIIDSTNLYEFENIIADMKSFDLSNDDNPHHSKDLKKMKLILILPNLLKAI